MSRIRSIHPTLFTDEAYMALSFAARELLKGLWCEADDQGVFEWKPLTIKARIMPADAVDMIALLDELVSGNFVKQITHDGKQLGGVRNFGKFQRPKKPANKHVIPASFRTYLGLKPVSTPPVGNEGVTAGGEAQQMEDGGGRREEETADATREKIRDRWAFKQLVLKAIGALDDPNCRIDAARVDAWIDGGADPELDILPTVERLMAKRGSQGPPTSLRYFDQAIADAIRTRTQPLPEGKHDASRSLQRDRDITGHGSRFAAWSAAAREPAEGADGPPIDHDRAA